MTDKLRDDLAAVVRQMRSIAEPNDHLLNSWANTIECHHAQIQRNAEDADNYRMLRDGWADMPAMSPAVYWQRNNIPTGEAMLDGTMLDDAMKAMRADGGEVES